GTKLMFKQLMVASGTLILAACGPLQTDSEVHQDGLVYCSEGNPESFNPQLGTSGTTVDATSAQIYDRLLDYDAKQQQFVPALARGWQALDNGTRYRFNLRTDVSFHSTDWFVPARKFNADDVVFSFNRWLNPNHSFHQVNGGRYPFFRSSGLIRLIDSIQRIDEHTVDIIL